MSDYSFTNAEVIHASFKSIQENIEKLYSVPEHFIGLDIANSIGMVKAKMSLEIAPCKTWQHISLPPKPTPLEKLEANLKARRWVSKYRRRNLLCRILDKP